MPIMPLINGIKDCFPRNNNSANISFLYPPDHSTRTIGARNKDLLDMKEILVFIALWILVSELSKPILLRSLLRLFNLDASLPIGDYVHDVI